MDAASLAISLCSLCIQGYRSFQSLKTLGTNAQVILSKLEIQEYRLQGLKQTIETIQGSTDTRDFSLVVQPVYNTLDSIRLITTDTGHLRAQYKLKIDIPPPEFDADEKSEPARPVVKMGKPRTIKWLLFDKANMEKLADDLRTLTDGLENLLALALRHNMPPTLVGAAIASLATSEPPALANLAAATAAVYPDIASDAERKLERLEAESGLAAASPRRADFFSPADFAGGADGGLRRVAMVAATREMVLLEWRALPEGFEGRERAVARLATASALLQVPRPAALRTLDSAGVAIDRTEGRAALVYRFPAGAARTAAPASLLGLLRDGDDATRPPLDDRFALALALAETVFRLHMSGWLHRSVGAHNVLFFTGSGGPAAVVRSGGLRAPFLTGFGFSREDGDGATSETVEEAPGVDRYRHPGCQGPFRAGFNKTYDLYSLGMVLLEIGVWKAFDKPPRYKPTSSASENHDRIVDKCLNGYLAHYMGNAYQGVARACLTGDFGCDVADDAAFQRRVYDVVVEPLTRLVSSLVRD